MDSGLLFLTITEFAAPNSASGTHEECQVIWSHQLLPFSCFSRAMAVPLIFGHGWLSKAKTNILPKI